MKIFSRKMKSVFILSVAVLLGSNFCFAQENNKESAEFSFDVLSEVEVQWTVSGQYQEVYTPEGEFDVVYDIKEIPEVLAPFIDKEVKIKGYLISGGVNGQGNYTYTLAENTWDGCCVGVPPTFFTSVIVHSKEKLKIDRLNKTTISGVFNINPHKQNDLLMGFFVLKNAKEISFGENLGVGFIISFFVLIVFVLPVAVIILIGVLKRKNEMYLSSIDEDELISCAEMVCGYGKKEILKDVNLKIKKGSLIGIIGPNGSGKTTLIRTLMGISPLLSGVLYRENKLRFGYVMQRQHLDTLYPFSVEEVVLMGRYGIAGPPKRMSKEDKKAVTKAMEFTGILEIRKQPLRKLSGGQKQRVLIARALACEPEVIVLDEPTNDMDLAGEENVLNLIKEIQKETNCAVIIVSHLLHTVLNVAEDIMFLKGDGNYLIFERDQMMQKQYLKEFYNLPVSIKKENGRYFIVFEKEA